MKRKNEGETSALTLSVVEATRARSQLNTITRLKAKADTGKTFFKEH